MTDQNLDLIIRARDQATQVIRTLNRQIDQLDGGLDRANKRAKTSQDVFSQLGRRLGVAAAAFLTFRTAAQAIEGFVNEASGLEDAVAGVVKTTGLAGPALDDFVARIGDISAEIPKGRQQLLGFAETAAQLGVQGASNLSKFAETLARLEDATDIQGEGGALAIAQLVNVTNGDFADIDRLGATIAALGNASATTESQILKVATEVGKAIGPFRGTSQQALALGAAYASLGQQAQLASSATGRTIREFQKAITDGGRQLQLFAQISGQTSEEFTQAFGDDAVGQFNVFLEGLGELADGERVTAMEELGLRGDELAKVLPVLASTAEATARSFDLANQSFRDGQALIEESNRRYETFSSTVVDARNALNGLQAVAGGQFLGSLNDTIQNITDGLRGGGAVALFQDFGDSIDRVVVAFDLFVERNEPLLNSLGSLVATVVDGIAALTEGILEVGGTATSLGGLQIAIGAIDIALASVVDGFRVVISLITLSTAEIQLRLLPVVQRLQNAFNTLLPEKFEFDTSDLEQDLVDITERADRAGATLQGILTGSDSAVQRALARQSGAAGDDLEAQKEARKLAQEKADAEEDAARAAEKAAQEKLAQIDAETKAQRELVAAQKKAAEENRASQFKIDVENVKQQAEEAVAEAERVFRDGGTSIVDYYQSIADAQRAAIDRQIELVQANANATGTGEAQRNAQVEIAKLQNDRRDIAIETAKNIAEAEQELAESLDQVRDKLRDLSNEPVSFDQQKEQIRREYADLIRQLEAEGDRNSINLIENIISREAAEAQLDQIERQVRERVAQLGRDIESINSSSFGVERDGLEADARSQASGDISEQVEQARALSETIGTSEATARLRELDGVLVDVSTNAVTMFDSVAQVFGQALQDNILAIVQGTKSISQGFRDMALAVVQEIQKIIVKMLILRALEAAAGVPPGTFSGGGGGGGILGQIAGGIQSNADGGFIRGPGTKTSDDILSWLSNGEYVIRADAVNRYGKNFFDALNTMRIDPRKFNFDIPQVNLPIQRIPAYAQGGLVTPNASQDTSQTIRIVNLFGDQFTEEMLDTPAGERVIMNTIQRNQ